MDKKIIARELASGRYAILFVFLSIVIVVISFMLALKISDIFPDIPIYFGIPGFFIITFGPMIICGYVFFKIVRKKIAVTPILHVDEKIPISKEQKEILDNVEGAQKLHGIVGIVTGSGGLLTELTMTAMLSAAKKGTHVKYTICDEGIVLYSASIVNLYRWKNIHQLKADSKNKQLEFKARGAKYNLYSPNKFDETKQVLHKYIEFIEVD